MRTLRFYLAYVVMKQSINIVIHEISVYDGGVLNETYKKFIDTITPKR